MIDILLPTYNGAGYLRQLLDSILNQTYKNFKIIVRDDCSCDGTLEILKEYQSDYPDTFRIMADGLGRQGTSGSNNLLIREVSSEYFMFCDQDDIWERTKIEESLDVMLREENLNPLSPILVCTDALCINEKNLILETSFFESQRFQDVTDSYHKMLALNVVQGATTLMNRRVLDYVRYIPDGLFHDWWVSVIVCYYGKVRYLHKPLLKYRQHSMNVVGANHIGNRYFLTKLIGFKAQFAIYRRMYQCLPFRPSILKWAFYKILFTIKRLIN